MRLSVQMVRLLITAIVAGAMTFPASADLVLLDNDRYIKVESYRVEGELIQMLTPDGASLEMSIERIERIIDDEIELGDISTTVPPTVEDRDWRFQRDRTPMFASPWDDWIMQIASEHDVDAALVSAVIKAESNFDPVAVSHKGAQGLMQLMPATAHRFGVAYSFDPVQNIRGGVRYLRVLLDMFDGDVELALAAYNAGEGNVRRYEGVPPFRETRTYIQRVVGYLSRATERPSALVTSSR